MNRWARILAVLTCFAATDAESAGSLLFVAESPGAHPSDWELRIDPEPVRPGDIVRVTLALDAQTEGGSVELGGRSFPLVRENDAHVAWVGVDMDVTPGRLPLAFELGDFSGRREITVSERKFGSESLKVASSYTDLDDATRARVGREAAMLRRIFAGVLREKLWVGDFVIPSEGPLGSPFGLRRVFNGKPRSPHSGLDVKSPEGSPIRCSNRGRVALAEDLFFTGGTVIVDHGLGLFTLYAHMSRIDVKPGQTVERGQLLGRVGKTGRVTGPHLHWAVKIAGARVDPVSLPGIRSGSKM